mgnify:FL=1
MARRRKDRIRRGPTVSPHQYFESLTTPGTCAQCRLIASNWAHVDDYQLLVDTAKIAGRDLALV